MYVVRGTAFFLPVVKRKKESKEGTRTFQVCSRHPHISGRPFHKIQIATSKSNTRRRAQSPRGHLQAPRGAEDRRGALVGRVVFEASRCGGLFERETQKAAHVNPTNSRTSCSGVLRGKMYHFRKESISGEVVLLVGFKHTWEMERRTCQGGRRKKIPVALCRLLSGLSGTSDELASWHLNRAGPRHMGKRRRLAELQSLDQYESLQFLSWFM